jgi:hemolysin III
VAPRQLRFSIRWFSLSVVLQFALLLVLFRFVAPTIWSRQLAAGPGAFLLVFLAMQMFNCFFEWGFHRYVLHARVHPWLSQFSRGHRHHHALTPIQMRSSEAGPGRIILSRYPITEDHQHEDAAFPPYALAAFWLLFSPLLIGFQALLPHSPILLGGAASITWSMYTYEVFHAVNHYPFEWWELATSHPRWGFLWKRVYGFHHFHHANINTNEAISGFLGLPVADWVFRTYNQPPDLLLHGRLATATMFHIRSPRAFVTRLDRWSRRREARLTRSKP